MSSAIHYPGIHPYPQFVQPKTPVDTKREPSSHPSSLAMFDLQNRMRLVHEVVKTRLDQRLQSIKARYDKSVSRQAEFQVGDKVMLRNTVISKDEERKFHHPYSGPFEVVETFHP
ncbi:unnamed protein product [Clavelina lepadiformis]|uniref:Uncharacterized protein n=1 Tax=Clavelina lepadiformis TaxID=159417 RepID=A0ABP0GB99_CLALP